MVLKSKMEMTPRLGRTTRLRRPMAASPESNIKINVSRCSREVFRSRRNRIL